MKELKIPEIKLVDGNHCLINGKKRQLESMGGCRKKVKHRNFLIKFEHQKVVHNDFKVYRSISAEDKRYFPKLFTQTEEYSIHEYVPHVLIDDETDTELLQLAYRLKDKYQLLDFAAWQFAKRKDTGELIIFDYGFVSCGNSDHEALK